MRYQSTRGGVSGLTFQQAVLMGLADDGGLLVPEAIPDVSKELGDWATLSWTELAHRIMQFYIDDIPAGKLAGLIERSYAGFD
ncbi:MAG: threonine synthase, partial [Pseudomonadales bacterium]|nr:threonine synthase [Pseudomonadales bacterium]